MNEFHKSTRLSFSQIISSMSIVYILFSLSGCNEVNIQDIPTHKPSILGTLPHDENMFTEGFFMENGIFWESSGWPTDLPQTETVFGNRDPDTGKIHVRATLDKEKFFGEWLVHFWGKFIWIMWKQSHWFIYDATTFEKITEFSLPTAEWWGLTHDEKSLIMSDGTNILTFLDPEKLTPIGHINVSEWGEPISKLNELEYFNGYIYANIWLTDDIVKIDSKTGQVVTRYDLSSIVAQEKQLHPESRELNGIAHDHDTGDFYITGKMWKNIYKIALD